MTVVLSGLAAWGAASVGVAALYSLSAAALRPRFAYTPTEETPMTTTTEPARTVYELARLADVADPDSLTSHGAAFLRSVEEDLAERVREEGRAAARDVSAEIVEAALPVNTYARWRTFCDLALWHEDLAGYIDPEADTTARAEAALFLAGDRLCSALLGEDDDQAATDADELAVSA